MPSRLPLQSEHNLCGKFSGNLSQHRCRRDLDQDDDVPDFFSINAIAVDPTNASVVYAGFAAGLFKTTDGGNNWNALNLPVNDASIQTIVFDPSTPSTMYVGSNAGVFKSTDSGGTWTPLNNFDVSSVPNIRSLAIDPTAPSTIYAGTSGFGLFKTTNGGSTWIPINNGISSGSALIQQSYMTIVIDPFNPSTLYIRCSRRSGINKSTNGGSSWAPVNNSAVVGGINAMVADHTTPSTLYVGTVGGGVIKTTDGGTSWTSSKYRSLDAESSVCLSPILPIQRSCMPEAAIRFSSQMPLSRN